MNFIDPNNSPGLDLLFTKFDERVISGKHQDSEKIFPSDHTPKKTDDGKSLLNKTLNEPTPEKISVKQSQDTVSNSEEKNVNFYGNPTQNEEANIEQDDLEAIPIKTSDRLPNPKISRVQLE